MNLSPFAATHTHQEPPAEGCHADFMHPSSSHPASSFAFSYTDRSKPANCDTLEARIDPLAQCADFLPRLHNLFTFPTHSEITLTAAGSRLLTSSLLFSICLCFCSCIVSHHVQLHLLTSLFVFLQRVCFTVIKQIKRKQTFLSSAVFFLPQYKKAPEVNQPHELEVL